MILHYTSNISMIFENFNNLLNISASSNNFWEHCSRVPPLFAPILVHLEAGRGLVLDRWHSGYSQAGVVLVPYSSGSPP
jgi:hypothetical protein